MAHLLDVELVAKPLGLREDVRIVVELGGGLHVWLTVRQ
jgi:hypothetical protein